MMNPVDTVELATIGARIQVPEEAQYRSAVRDDVRRAGRGGGSDSGRDAGSHGDRLADLAGWWATVAGTAPPRRVEQLWLTRPSSAGPARAEVLIRRFGAPADIDDALTWGVAVADDAVDDGTDLILLSIQDDESWPVLAALLLGVDPVEAVGWPAAAGLSDQAWTTRVAAIRDGLRAVRDLDDQPEALLHRLASPALAAGTAVLLQAAARRTPALLDGPAATACALLGFWVTRSGPSWWQATDAGAGALHARMLTELRLTPITRLGLRAEDGTAARIGLDLLETAIARALDSDDELDDDQLDSDELDQLDDAEPGGE